MAIISRFEDLESWQMARALSRRIYEVTNRPEFGRDVTLKDQIRRTASSIMSNVAEGFERNNNREFYNFIRVAKASCGALRSQIYNCIDRGFIEEAEFLSLKQDAEILGSKLRGFMDYLAKINSEDRKRRRLN